MTRTVSADVLAPNIASPSAGTMLASLKISSIQVMFFTSISADPGFMWNSLRHLKTFTSADEVSQQFEH